MLNPATNPPEDGFNEFTRELKTRLDNGIEVQVELRDGRIVELEWFVEVYEEEDDEDTGRFCYRQNNCYLIWNNDGTSITSDRFDIMGDVE